MRTRHSAIGPISVPTAGERASGLFTFAGDPGLAKYTWPYIAISGRVSGPTVLVTAGIHAAEYTGVEAAIRLGRGIDPTHGRVGHVGEQLRDRARVRMSLEEQLLTLRERKERAHSGQADLTRE